MISIVHMIVGGAVGVAVGTITQNPLAAVAAGVASHLVCDAIPHLDHPPNIPEKDGEIVWTPLLFCFAIADSVIAALIIFALWYSRFDFPNLTPFIAGAIGGYLPDFIDNVPFWRNKIRSIAGFRQFHKFHEAIHAFWSQKYPMPQFALMGILSQVVVVSLSLWYLLTH